MAFFSKKFFISFLALSCIAHADSSQSDFFLQLAYKDNFNQNTEIIDYDHSRDYESIKQIIKDGWSGFARKPYTEEGLQELLKEPQLENRTSLIKVARIKQQTVGFTKLEICNKPTNNHPHHTDYAFNVEVELVGVSPNFRNQGIASQLLSVAQEIAEKNKATYLNMYVFEENKNAINLYKKLGFIAVPTPRKKIPLMTKALKTPQCECKPCKCLKEYLDKKKVHNI